MKTLGLTLATGLMLAVASSESQAQVTIGNPYNGQGITIGPNGVTPSGYGYNNGYNNGYGNRYGYNASPYSYGNGGYRIPGTNYYSSGYQAPGVLAPQQYNYGTYQGYGASGYRYPTNYGRAYTYPGTTYNRGVFGRVRVR